MCLDSITKQYEAPSPLIVGGFKGFNGTAKKPSFSAYMSSKVVLELDTWIKAEKIHGDASAHVTVSGYGRGSSVSYAPGFHGFTGDLKSLPSGYGSIKLPVFYRGIHTIGKQSSVEVVVADELYIPSKPDGWPPKERTAGATGSVAPGGVPQDNRGGAASTVAPDRRSGKDRRVSSTSGRRAVGATPTESKGVVERIRNKVWPKE